jgi:hypothetical protein
MTRKVVVLAAMTSLAVLAACDRGGDAGQEVTAPEKASGTAPGPDRIDVGAPPPDHQYRLDYRPEMIGRIYATDFGEMILDRHDRESVAGRYAGREADDQSGGTFDGVVQPADDPVAGRDQIVGHWYAPTGAQRCDEARNDTHYWGQIQFNFPRDSTGFIGFYGHCEGTPLDRWNGAFVRRDPVITAAVAAQMP